MRRLDEETETSTPKEDTKIFFWVALVFAAAALGLGITFTALAATTPTPGTIQTTYIVLTIVFYVLAVVFAGGAYMMWSKEPASSKTVTSRVAGSSAPSGTKDPFVRVVIYGSVAFVALIVGLIFLILALSTPVGTFQTIYIVYTVIYFAVGGLLAGAALWAYNQPPSNTFDMDILRAAVLHALLYAGLAIVFAIHWALTAVGFIQTWYIVFTFVFIGVAVVILGWAYYYYQRKFA